MANLLTERRSYVDGAFIEGPAAFDVENPATGEVCAAVDDSPGVIATASTLGKIPEAVLDDLVASQALPVRLAAGDLTGTALYFASDDARWVTGQVVCIDGGRVMPA